MTEPEMIDPTLEETMQSADSAPRKPADRHIVFLIIVMIIVIIQIGFTFYYNVEMNEFADNEQAELKDSSPDPALISTLAAFERRLASMEEEQQTLDRSLSSLELDFEHAAASENEALETRIAALEAQLHQEIAELREGGAMAEERLEAINGAEQNLQEVTAQSKAQWQLIQLFGASDALDYAVQNGAPFTRALLGLQLAGGDIRAIANIIERLQPYAESGVPQLAALEQAMAEAIASHAQLASKAPEGPIDELKQNLASLVTIRKIGANHNENDDAARIARAEYQLGQGEIKAALAEIKALSAPAQPFFVDWRDAARAYLDAHAAMDDLRQLVDLRFEQADVAPIDAPSVERAPIAPDAADGNAPMESR